MNAQTTISTHTGAPAIGTPLDLPSGGLAYVVDVKPCERATFTLIGGPAPMTRDRFTITAANARGYVGELSENIAAPMIERARGLPPTSEQAPPKRTPAHERAIRRAWAERKARREAREVAQGYWQRWEEMRADRDRHAQETLNEIGGAMILKAKRRRAVLAAREAKRSARYFIRQSGAHYDRAINAEHEAREALAAREDLKRMLADAEARLAAAEAENAQLWSEIETLTAPTSALAA